MKKYILLIFCNFLFCQNQNLYVEYNLKINNEQNLFANNNYLKENFKKSVDNKADVVFGLEINKAGSKFKFRPELSGLNEEINNFSLALACYSGEIYNFNNDTILKQNKLLGDNFYVKNDATQNWILSDETKIINKYLCYKATNIYKVVNPSRTFYHPVVAWYCPDLPFKYGPNGYGNLPGLILELQVRNSVFECTIVAKNKYKNFDTIFVREGTILTEIELNKKLEELNGF